MADLIDIAAEIEREHVARGLAAVRAARFEPGAPGECEACGEQTARIVDGRCAPCREPRVPRRW